MFIVPNQCLQPSGCTLCSWSCSTLKVSRAAETEIGDGDRQCDLRGRPPWRLPLVIDAACHSRHPILDCSSGCVLYHCPHRALSPVCAVTTPVVPTVCSVIMPMTPCCWPTITPGQHPNHLIASSAHDLGSALGGGVLAARLGQEQVSKGSF